MAKLHRIVLATTAAIVLGGIMSVGAEARMHCVRAGGEATMITEDLAKFMAQAALKNSIAGMGAKPVGPVNLKCSMGQGLPYCIARQKACK
jgi:hypothetical protein